MLMASPGLAEYAFYLIRVQEGGKEIPQFTKMGLDTLQGQCLKAMRVQKTLIPGYYARLHAFRVYFTYARWIC